MPVPVSALILACRRAFEVGDDEAVLALSDPLTTLHPERAEACIGLGRPAEALAPYAATDYAAKFGGMGFAYDLGWIGEQLVDQDRLMAH